MKQLAGEALLVAGKDLRIEMRSRVVLNQVLPFGGLVLLLFAFALDPDRGLLPRVAPGLFWTAVLLAGLLAISRSFAIEADHGARDGLRLSGLDPAAIFLGKVAGIVAELVALEVLLAAGVFLLYDIDPTGWTVLVVASLLATLGLASAGSVYGALAAGLRVRETLMPLLLLPVVSPVMLGATRAWEAALEGTSGEAWPWVQVMAVFAVLYTALGVLSFGSLLEES
ncbi:MAG TPA: heme exporter protein CcmB [Acidimicrobiia bacterium]|nr:heme exporter protein CcmB [Acidimicrobiia bacterium]